MKLISCTTLALTESALWISSFPLPNMCLDNLAPMVGINCAEVRLTTSLGKDVLLVRRFDRHWVSDHECRRGLVSALSLLKLDEMHARYASYEDFAEVIRLHFRDQENDRLELFKRLVFNILIGNTDDHARNHAAIWDGVHLRLSPAYDICPHPRTGQEASQAMFIQGSNNSSQIKTCLAVADYFGLTREAAVQEYEFQRSVIESQWESVCDEADLSRTDRNLLWGRSVLNPYCFYDV